MQINIDWSIGMQSKEVMIKIVEVLCLTAEKLGEATKLVEVIQVSRRFLYTELEFTAILSHRMKPEDKSTVTRQFVYEESHNKIADDLVQAIKSALTKKANSLLEFSSEMDRLASAISLK